MDESRGGPLSFLQGGGELGQLIGAKNWAETPLGPAELWPQSLKTTLGLILRSRYPMFVFWGRDLVKIYNDAYRPIVGQKHPWALGRTATEVWPEIWSDIEPLVTRALAGDSTWSDDLMLFMERNGFPEEVYFTFSYSPVPDESGGIGGMFCACTETTPKVLGERRLRTLRDLAASPAEARTVQEACDLSVHALDSNRADIPFALLYLSDDGGTARLVARFGVDGNTAAPAALGPLDDGPWPVCGVIETRVPRLTSGFAERLARALPGPWPEPPTAAMVLPLVDRAIEAGVGALVLGISSRRPFDDEYREWFGLVAAQVGASIANARAAEEERRRAEALAEIDRAKTTFFSNISHEFRTPLTLMLGPTEDALASPDRTLAGDNLDTVHRNEIRLLKLVNALLDFSRIEAGRMQASFEPTDLSGLTADLASSFRSAFERAGLDYTVDCKPLRAPVEVDRDQWEKIVLNLLSNALKFTFDGSVQVILDEDDRHVTLTLRDTGVGIPKAEVPRLFERFHRIEGARARTHEGSGIGLALVSDLVRLHHGCVKVDSTEGVGTTVTVSLPRSTRMSGVGTPRPLGGPPASSPYVLEALRWLPDRDAGAANDGRPPAESADAGSSSRILVADDNADMRQYLMRLLGDRWTVETVADGQAALEAARARHPDLILTDVMMPGLDGYALLRELRADARTSAIPVIILSARAGEEARVEGLQSGADDYLTKPFNARELIARVSGTLALAAARRETATALQESEERFRHMADHAPVMIWVTEADGSCSFISKSWYDFTGQAPGAGLGLGWLDAVHPNDLVPARERFLAANAAMEPFRVEYRLRHRDGSYRWAIDAAVPRFDAGGAFLGYVGSVIDITERKDTETRRETILAAERSARREAERVNRMKDEFLATLSHELRTPLNAILGWSQVLDRDDVTAVEMKKGLATISRNARAQARMIEDLLDLSRIVSGKVRIDVLRLSLADVVEQAVLSALPAANARGVRLERILDSVAGPISGDPGRLQQVFWNLLTNAVKFTSKGGKVQVVLQRVDSHVQVTVSDTGEGIEPEMLPHLFERFRQADATTTRRHGGLGLGLSIVKELVELHGGSVHAASAGLGKGSTFTVRLPLAVAVEPAADGDHRQSPVAGPATLLPGRPDLAGLILLVVDDDEDARLVIQHILEECGATVIVAATADEAVERLTSQPPDLLLSDIGMPREDGYELIRRVRALPASAGGGVPAIALTAYARSEDRQRTLRAGFQMHLAKPVDRAELLTVCASLTSRL